MEQNKIPVILVDKSSFNSFKIFNPNKWEKESKAIIQSCATELSLIEYIVKKLEIICSNSKSNCIDQFMTLVKQWKLSPWDISRSNYYAQKPEMHYQIIAFFSITKSLLDIIVQLLYSEKIVDGNIHGFHKVKHEVGGNVLNLLKNNSTLLINLKLY